MTGDTRAMGTGFVPLPPLPTIEANRVEPVSMSLTLVMTGVPPAPPPGDEVGPPDVLPAAAGGGDVEDPDVVEAPEVSVELNVVLVVTFELVSDVFATGGGTGATNGI